MQIKIRLDIEGGSATVAATPLPEGSRSRAGSALRMSQHVLSDRADFRLSCAAEVTMSLGRSTLGPQLKHGPRIKTMGLVKQPAEKPNAKEPDNNDRGQ